MESKEECHSVHLLGQQNKILPIMSAWGKGGSARSCDALLKRVENNDPNLKELVILPIKSFGKVEASRLAKGILHNTNLKSISASGHSMDVDSLNILGSSIAKVFHENKDTLKSRGVMNIAIGDKNLGDEGVTALCSPLVSCHGGYLTLVDLELKKITGKGVGVIGRVFSSSTNLRHLNISRNPDIGDDGLLEFVEKVQECHDNDEGQVFPSLEYLDLSQCNIGPKGVKSFSNLFLNIGENTIPRNTFLTLKLNENPIANEGMRSLSHLISSNVFSSSKDRSSMLVSLSLQQCNIDDEGIEILTSAVKEHGCAGLCELDMAKNKIGERGSEMLGKCFQAGSWKTLNNLNLASNPLGTNGSLAICEGVRSLKKIEHLNLCETNCGAEGAIAAISLQNVVSLRLFNNKLGSIGFEKIAANIEGGHVSIVNLDLGGNSAKEEAVVTLLKAISIKNGTCKNSSLKVLEIGGNEMGPDAEKALRNLQEIYPDLDVARDRPKRQN